MITFLLAITAEQFGQGGKAWVEAIGLVLDSLIGKIGVLGLAAIGVWKSLSQKADAKEAKAKAEEVDEKLSARMDLQGQRIHEVSLSVPPANGHPAAPPLPTPPGF